LALELSDPMRIIDFDAPHDFELRLIEDNKRGLKLSDCQLELAGVIHVEGLAVHIKAIDYLASIVIFLQDDIGILVLTMV
jgi:hypothetical protein